MSSFFFYFQEISQRAKATENTHAHTPKEQREFPKETAAKSNSQRGRPDSATESDVSEAREREISRLTWICPRIHAKLGSWTNPDPVRETNNMRKPVETHPDQIDAYIQKEYTDEFTSFH